jgi:hypothetical protein
MPRSSCSHRYPTAAPVDPSLLLLSLDHLESHSSSDGDKKMLRFHTTRCLAQTISCCREEPLKLWDVSADTVTERIQCLLNICRELKAEEEIISLMELLG